VAWHCVSFKLKWIFLGYSLKQVITWVRPFLERRDEWIHAHTEGRAWVFHASASQTWYGFYSAALQHWRHQHVYPLPWCHCFVLWINATIWCKENAFSRISHELVTLKWMFNRNCVYPIAGKRLARIPSVFPCRLPLTVWSPYKLCGKWSSRVQVRRLYNEATASAAAWNANSTHFCLTRGSKILMPYRCALSNTQQGERCR